MSRAAEYNAVAGDIKNHAAFSILAGFAGVAYGLTMGDHWAGGALAAGGALLVADSIWVMQSPVSFGVRPLGIALFIVGVFVLGTNSTDTSSNAPYLGAIFCFAGGYHVLADYRRISKGDLKNALSENPTPEDIAADEFSKLVDDVAMSTMASDPRHIQFRTADLFSILKWDGRLRDNDVVLHFASGSKMANTSFTMPGERLVPKDEFEIIVGRKHLFSGLHSAKFRFGSVRVPGPPFRHLRGTIDQDSLDRYDKWKLASSSRRGSVAAGAA